MCGIIAYNGTKKVDSVLLNALKAMEYRGYDSAGVAVFGGGNPVLHRALGEVNNLSEQVLQESFTSGVGIGHTRWATHGGVSLDNTHPHYSQDESVYLVHNGIIENFTEIKSFLEKEGVSFYGQTDTEILANLVAYHLKKEDSLVSALKKTLKEARGAYGLAVVEVANPNEIVVAKNGSPIILGVADHGLILASDVNAIIPYTRDILYMQDGEMAILRENNDYQILNFQGDAKDRPLEHVDHDIGMVEKGDFEYFMLKEIYEQPAVIYNTARGRINYDTGEVKLGGLE
ncbi:MAG: class II glutamine amidotransferase [Patescibacteria group bacterium]|nr:class II glutamine amidotransferase [Patescibacteria group bacterium]